MSGRDGIQSLLVLRKLTRAITEAVRVEMTGHLATLTPLLKASTIFGDYMVGGKKEPTRNAEKAFKQLQGLYDTIAVAKPFNLPRELSPPMSLPSETLEITPYDYAHVADNGIHPRTISVRAPLTWTLTYSGYNPAKLEELLNTKLRSTDELLKFVLSYLVLHVVINSQPGIVHMLEALRFPVSTIRVPEFGNLPITRIGPPITTARPSDAVMLESAELSGMDAFEELVKVDDLARLNDPLRERLLAIAHEYAPESITR